MPIPLGILAQFRQAAAGDFVLLSSQVLTSNQASVTFSNLATLAAGYKHLQVRLVLRNGRNDPDDNTRLTFNGDSSSSYRDHYLFGDGSSVSSTTFSGTYSELKVIAGNSNSSGIFSAGVVDILDPFITSKNTTLRSLAGMTGSANRIFLQSSLYTKTDAITSITFTGAFGSYLTGSRFSLYGIRG